MWFVENYGEENLRRWGIASPQVEMDALDPNVLHQLFQDAIDRYWDRYQYQAVLEQEAPEKDELADLARRWRDR